MLRFFIICLIVSFLGACKIQPGTIVREKDYEPYIKGSKNDALLLSINRELQFWGNRLISQDDVVAQMKMASGFMQKFDYAGSSADLDKADSLFQKANSLLRKNSSDGYRSLASLAITRHQFTLARSYLDSALVLGDHKYKTLLMLFDVALELGDRPLAWQTLNRFGNSKEFDILIRTAKWEDQVNGDLGKAISLMEQAAETTHQQASDPLHIWAKSNLADMYVHNGQYKKAYNTYLYVLSIDPGNQHCLKGISWLAFSHDKNAEAAKKILHFIMEENPSPGYDLLLAEIASFEGNKHLQDQYTNAFLDKLEMSRDKTMYNIYLFKIYAEQSYSYNKALLIAKEEVKNRPTPESYSLLSYAYGLTGDTQQALLIAKEHVENKSVEPHVLYRLGKLYKMAGNKSQTRKYFLQAAESSVELGPLLYREIQENLKGKLITDS